MGLRLLLILKHCGGQERNVNGMKLVSGSGNDFENGKPLEDDKINTIYVLDSDALPFHRAEVYHQFHDGVCHETGQHMSGVLTVCLMLQLSVTFHCVGYM
jgi:hypothetical protein